MTKTEWKISSHHRAAYGAWAGNEKGRRPDPDRCAEEVHGDYLFHQCNRKRGYGPEQAFCKQHSPEAKQAREDARKAKHDAEMSKWRKERAESDAKDRALDLIKQIAAGHNDPRGAAIDLLNTLSDWD